MRSLIVKPVISSPNTEEAYFAAMRSLPHFQGRTGASVQGPSPAFWVELSSRARSSPGACLPIPLRQIGPDRLLFRVTVEQKPQNHSHHATQGLAQGLALGLAPAQTDAYAAFQRRPLTDHSVNLRIVSRPTEDPANLT